MNQEQIDAYNDEQSLSKEKAGADALAIALSRSVSQSVSESSSEVQQAIVESLKVLLKVIKENEPNVTVKNQPTFPSSISTPDIARVVTAVSELKQAVSQKETDFTAVIKSLEALSKSVANLPKPVDTVTVKNQPDYSKELGAIEKAVGKIDVRPVVNLPEPRVTVTSDFKEITKQLTDVIKAVNSIKFPDIPKNDFSEVTKAVRSVKDTINGLRFPVPNFILPFKDINGKAVQVQLDASGNVPTSGGGGGGAITNDGTFAKETGGNLDAIAAKDFATQTTLALIKAKTDNLDVALSTRAVTGLTDTQLRAAPVPVSGTVTVSNPTTNPETGLAKDVSLGSLTETAPASDTASSGLNGRLQRIAQRLTSIIALLPGSLGQKARAASLAVTLSTEDVTALTPPAAITGFATSAKQDTLAGKIPDQEGTWGYSSGASGTITLTGGKRVLQITAIKLGAAGAFNINSGDTIILPYNATDKSASSLTFEPKGNLTDPTLNFTTTDSYCVEWLV